MSPQPKRQGDPLEAVIASYKRLPGVADELLDKAGVVRPVWRKFVEYLIGLSKDDVAARFARGDQHLRDAGVFFRQYGAKDSTERDWPLSHVPILIHESEWTHICEGLTQRAELLEVVVADLYGQNRLVEDGHLPASLIGMNKEWLRPLVGVKPNAGHLNFLAFEIGRGPDGNWWVLGDRTQAPSGAGFALETRIATARVFSEFYRNANVYRLAGFFQSFRDSLRALRNNKDSQVAILTPGLWNETYFEHAYIARYLGLMLLEGEDLTVERGEVMVRTVAGLAPVSVLWSRLDAAYADPLELDERSHLGTPGIVESVRRGNLTMVNALGSGVLETRALLAFLPRICEAIRAEPLKLSNIATWWCGGEKEREYVRANIERMTVGPALSTRPPFEADDKTVMGGRFREASNQTVEAYLEREGQLLVAQEAVTLSTTPAYIEGQLAPRPMAIRVFMARTQNGWQVMPGGYARIGRTEDATAIAMQRGGSVADVWVVSDHPVASVSMLPSAGAPYRRTEPGVLPSRAADNLYWLGRYVERAEGIMRLLRAYHSRLAETANPEAPLLVRLREHLAMLDVDTSETIPEGLRNAITAAIQSASRVRDRFSIDGWAALSDLAKTARQMKATAAAGDDAARAMGVLLRKITGFSGLVHENMYRSVGWRFLSLGRSLERALATSSTLATFADPEAPEGALDLAVEVGDSSMTHRSRYAVATNRNTVIDLLAFDAQNPRSIIYHLTEIQDQARDLSAAVGHEVSDLSDAIRRTYAALTVHTAENLDTAALTSLGDEIAMLSDVLSGEYLK